MVQRTLKSGDVTYYWTPRAKDVAAGCTVHGEALGPRYAEARDRAEVLNRQLDAWRGGRGAVRSLDLQPAYGTLAWLVERYKRSPAWDRVSERNRPYYAYILGLVLAVELTSGDTLGQADLQAITARAVDKAYLRLRSGPRTKRTRTAVMCIARMARAWDVVARLYPEFRLGRGNDSPWRGVEMEHGGGTTTPASRDEAYALSTALAAAGHPWLAAVPLVCYEWHQRPENVLAGHLTWEDYRPADRPNWVRIFHHKTGERVWLPLRDADGPLYPEITAYLDRLPQIAPELAVVIRERQGKGEPMLIDRHRAAEIVRQARKAAGLGAHVTLAACRHGGLTELGNAELTEQQTMALSGHRTPDAARLYVKRTEAQRSVAARRRRAWVEAQSSEQASMEPEADGMRSAA